MRSEGFPNGENGRLAVLRTRWLMGGAQLGEHKRGQSLLGLPLPAQSAAVGFGDTRHFSVWRCWREEGGEEQKAAEEYGELGGGEEELRK